MKAIVYTKFGPPEVLQLKREMWLLRYWPEKEEKMNKKRLVVEFTAVFTVALVTTALVTFLWNLIGHGESAADWQISFSLAITFVIILIWVKSREIKRKRIQKEGE